MRAFSWLFMISVVMVAGCGGTSKTQSKEAVQKAIEAYLAQRQNLMLANMNMEVAEVRFEGDTAEAVVRFRSKQSASLAVSVHYKLKRTPGGWQVESSTSAGGTGNSPLHGMTPTSPAPAHGTAPLESSH
ncbi:MAG: hypothetical protein L0191_15265 [Acidobacteria bacterium]|nr:hypothetical protein [Acidobacteriota bacterium]